MFIYYHKKTWVSNVITSRVITIMTNFHCCWDLRGFKEYRLGKNSNKSIDESDEDIDFLFISHIITKRKIQYFSRV